MSSTVAANAKTSTSARIALRTFNLIMSTSNTPSRELMASRSKKGHSSEYLTAESLFHGPAGIQTVES